MLLRMTREVCNDYEYCKYISKPEHFNILLVIIDSYLSYIPDEVHKFYVNPVDF
jgi:hypothetical protein